MRCVVVVSKKLGLSVLQSVICSVEGLITVVTCDDQTDPRSAYTEITAFCKEQSLDLKVMKGANLNNYFITTRNLTSNSSNFQRIAALNINYLMQLIK